MVVKAKNGTELSVTVNKNKETQAISVVDLRQTTVVKVVQRNASKITEVRIDQTGVKITTTNDIKVIETRTDTKLAIDYIYKNIKNTTGAQIISCEIKEY